VLGCRLQSGKRAGETPFIPLGKPALRNGRVGMNWVRALGRNLLVGLKKEPDVKTIWRECREIRGCRRASRKRAVCEGDVDLVAAARLIRIFALAAMAPASTVALR
jgi:hypothetical protein